MKKTVSDKPSLLPPIPGMLDGNSASSIAEYATALNAKGCKEGDPEVFRRAITGKAIIGGRLSAAVAWARAQVEL